MKSSRGILAVVAGGIAGGFYAAMAIYGAGQVTRRPRLLPQMTPDAIAAAWEPARFDSRSDRLALRGWWFPVAGAERALIMVHGYGQNRFDVNWQSDVIAREFLARRYSILMFDLRGHGESSAARHSFGVREKNDVLGALDFVRGLGYDPAQIGVLGISFGAAATLLAVPEMPEVGAVVADSGFAEIWPVIAAQIRRQQRVLAKLRPGPGIRLAARALHRVDLLAARPIDAVTRTPERVILFIHGAADDFIPPDHSERLLAASANPESELWLVPGAAHALTFASAPGDYAERVAAFLDAQLAARPAGTAEPADVPAALPEANSAPSS